jgi:hypothetical protein
MASEWEMAMGVELGMGMGTYHGHHHNASSITTAPMSSHHSGGASYSTPHHHHYYGMPPMGGDAMRVDELLDLSTGAGAHDFFPTAAGAAGADNGHHHHSATMGEPSPTANSSDHQTSLLSFADEFYIPVSTHQTIAQKLPSISNIYVWLRSLNNSDAHDDAERGSCGAGVAIQVRGRLLLRHAELLVGRARRNGGGRCC